MDDLSLSAESICLRVGVDPYVTDEERAALRAQTEALLHESWARHIASEVKRSYLLQEAVRYGAQERDFVRASLQRDEASDWLIEMVLERL